MKFKTRNKSIILKVILLIIVFIVFIYSFLYLMYNTKTKDIIIGDITNKFSNRNILLDQDIKSKLVYMSLPKVVGYESTPSIEEETHFIDIEIKKEKPIIYIYNTHQTEEYEYKRLEHSIKPSVLYASFILKDYLNDLGIESIIETNSMKDYLNKNNLEYKNSYDASRFYMKNAIEKYNSFEYFIDIHRDSSKIDKTLYEKDGKRYARIMFVVGLKHNNYNKNLEFVTKFNNIINDNYKGLSRGIYKRDDARFNQDISDKCILIELGGVDNTLEEVNNTLEIVAKILSDIIGENNGN